MATRAEILSARSTAGGAYAAALAALRSALVELAAHDGALASNSFGPGDPTVPPQPAHTVRTFGELPSRIPPGILHPDYPAANETANLHDAIRARRDELIATVTG